MNKEEKEQWLYEAYRYTSNFDFSRLDKYEEANDDICIDDLILDYTMLYELHKEEIERLNNIIKELREMLEHKVEFHKNLDFYEDKDLETQAYYNYVACLQDFDEIVEKYKLGK